VPQPTRESQIGRVLVLPQEPRSHLGVLPPWIEVDVHFVSHPSRGAQERIVLLVPYRGRQELEIQPPRLEIDLHVLPSSPLGSPQRFVHNVSLGRQDLEVLPSRQWVELRLLPQPPGRTQRRCVPELPQPRIQVDVQALLHPQLLLVSQGALEPLRLDLPELSLAEQILVERHLQPSAGPWWQAQLLKLRLHQVPPWQWQGAGPLLLVPRQHHGAEGRLTARESQG
jgi:hypothetical protein